MAKGQLSRIYKDIDMAFGLNVVSSDVNKKLDVNAVKQSLKNLLLVKKYERKFNPTIESPIYKFLFENSLFIKPMVERTIKELIQTYEPRVVIQNINVKEDVDNLYWKIDLFYYVKGVDKPDSLSLKLDRIR
jgi:phage baseplate assembly protein W|tara:strand:- start:16722 stop:17117 length:396 start_codon:yes stop_codon:yes gene_type:complete